MQIFFWTPETPPPKEDPKRKTPQRKPPNVTLPKSSPRLDDQPVHPLQHLAHPVLDLRPVPAGAPQVG